MSWSEGEITSLACGVCGTGLTGLPDDILLCCRGCDSVWSIESGCPEKVALSVLPSPEAPALHLPFWLVDISVKGGGILVRDENCPARIEFPRELDTSAERGLEFVETKPCSTTAAVPAFACDRAAGFGSLLSPILGTMEGRPHQVRFLAGGVMSGREARETAHAVLIAGLRRDNPGLARVDLVTETSAPSLAAVGFDPVERGLRLAGTRLVLPYTALADARALLCFSGHRTRSSAADFFTGHLP